jgi:hypothetical protein
MTKEKTVAKDELVKIIRDMVKESLESHAKVLKESDVQKNDKVNKISIKQLREMVRDTIIEVINEETENKKK